MSKGGGTETVTQTTQLPPEQTRAINAITSEALGFLGQQATPGFSMGGFGGFGGGFPGLTTQGAPATDPLDIIAPLAQPTLQGIQQLQQGPDPRIAQLLGDTVSGEFLGAGLGGVEDAILQAATRAVSDRFSQAGRAGSPGEALSLAGTVSRELAPFAFDAFNRERSRQLVAADQLTGLGRQSAQDLLSAGNILQGQRQAELREPLTRLQLVTNPIGTVIGGAPSTTTTEQPLNRNVGSGLIGGGLAGAGLGQALGFAGAGPLAPFAVGGALLGGLL